MDQVALRKSAALIALLLLGLAVFFSGLASIWEAATLVGVLVTLLEAHRASRSARGAEVAANAASNRIEEMRLVVSVADLSAVSERLRRAIRMKNELALENCVTEWLKRLPHTLGELARLEKAPGEIVALEQRSRYQCNEILVGITQNENFSFRSKELGMFLKTVSEIISICDKRSRQVARLGGIDTEEC